MIASLTGTLVQKSPTSLVVDVQGVGYQVYSSLSTFYNLPDPPAPVTLHTYTYLREETLELYGFLTRQEREVFVKLLTVSGVGPKMAVTLLSGMPLADLVTAIQEGDDARLSTIPGIGKKTAGRLALELKDKLLAISLPHAGGKVTEMQEEKKRVEDVLSALVTLGYTRQTAKDAVEKVVKEKNGTPSVESLLKESLKVLSQRS